MKTIKTNNRKKRGAALVEYGLLVAGVALTTAAAVSLLGHKTNDLVGTVAGALPSSNVEDNGEIRSGKLFAIQNTGEGMQVDFSQNWVTEDVFGTGAGDMINDPNPAQ